MKRLLFLISALLSCYLSAFAIAAPQKYTARIVNSLTASAAAICKQDNQAAAPEFPSGLQWLNTEKPISIKALRGKIVILDFWTYCCINCMHIIPDLKKLEAKYPTELVVIGVHSAKFENEKDTQNIRNAIKRYDIEHPVINDKDMKVWRIYGANSWPSVFLIDPDGNVVGEKSGEGVFDPFDRAITILLKKHEGKINREPLNLKLEKHQAPKTTLSFPGKIAADTAGNRLFISDSNNNRILITTTSGGIKYVIGAGTVGFKDGDFEHAQFFRPQGVCYDSKTNVLYVADTENHAIRQIDLAKKSVSTLAGTGKQSTVYPPKGGPAISTALSSPWDLVEMGELLYIAMAGSHQLWTLNLKTNEVRPYAGSGMENIVDGPLEDANLAQPSGITTDGVKLFVADSEVSAVRAVEIGPHAQVKTLIGKGLFDFADIDGKFPKARLQHPIGVAYHAGFVYVADTYNHKIKKLNPRTQEIHTLAGTGKRGANDGPVTSALLNEPNGLTFVGETLFIADTNNHAIRILDLKTNTLSTLKLTGAMVIGKR